MEGVWTSVDFFKVADRARKMNIPRRLLEDAELAFVLRQDEEQRLEQEQLAARAAGTDGEGSKSGGGGGGKDDQANATAGGGEKPKPKVTNPFQALIAGIGQAFESVGRKAVVTNRPAKATHTHNVKKPASHTSDEWEDLVDEVSLSCDR